MKYISHRGNLCGPDPIRENTFDYITTALNDDFDVEVDVRFVKGGIHLGHDSAGELVDIEFLKNPCLWIHAKTIETLYELLRYEQINCFFHYQDQCTLTSKGYIWTYPGWTITPLSIEIKHDFPNRVDTSAFGLCSNSIAKYREYK